MKEIILLKIGELVLKGLNRRTFEDKLIKNIKTKISKYGEFEIKKAQSIIYIEPKRGDADMEKIMSELKQVFGIAALSKAGVCNKDMDEICDFSIKYLKDILLKAKTFKVEAKRSDKAFLYNSPQICAIVGEAVLKSFPNISVDVHNPDITITVEIRDFAAYVHSEKIAGAGGMPAATNGKALLMLSGGLDSPVAGYMCAKRGVELDAIYFCGYPYTSERAKQKVVDLARILCNYCNKINLYVVAFTEIQTNIKKCGPQDLITLVMRKIMMEIACSVAKKTKSQAIITGESIGQVASQTLHALAATDAAADMPVFRPVIGMDKIEIVRIAHQIGTYETSILPYEDCCSIFTPKHPKTRPSVEEVKAARDRFDYSSLIERALNNIEIIEVKV